MNGFDWGPRWGGSAYTGVATRIKNASPTVKLTYAVMSCCGVMLLVLGLALAMTGGRGAPTVVIFGGLLMIFPVISLYLQDALGGATLSLRVKLGEFLDKKSSRRSEGISSHTGKVEDAAPSVEPDNALARYQKKTRSMYGCAFLGFNAATNEWSVANRRNAILVIGPPQSGKTSSLIIPSILSASGPVVSTSTKADVLRCTARARSQLGTVWLFDPLGCEIAPEGVVELRWSPVSRSVKWDSAREMAEAMVGATQVGESVQDGAYWTESAKTLIAPLLHAAALGGKSIIDVRRAISRVEVEAFAEILRGNAALAAEDDLLGISDRTDLREKSSIFATARLVLAGYGSDEVAKRSCDVNFDADAFVRSRDSLYITSPGQSQALVAPLVVGLLDEIRDAAYRLAREEDYSDRRNHPVFWALDEVANIAPLKKLPSIVSEAGGQGLQIMVCLQDLSQARVRWGAASDGFLSLFGIKAILPGIGDRNTLESISMMAGDWDRPYQTYSSTTGKTTSFGFPTGVSVAGNRSDAWSITSRREAQITPSEVANIPPGHILLLQSTQWSLLRAAPFYENGPWKEVCDEAPKRILRADGDEIREDSNERVNQGWPFAPGSSSEVPKVPAQCLQDETLVQPRNLLQKEVNDEPI